MAQLQSIVTSGYPGGERGLRRAAGDRDGMAQGVVDLTSLPAVPRAGGSPSLDVRSLDVGAGDVRAVGVAAASARAFGCRGGEESGGV